ncbi:two-component sensor kinase/response regulator [Escherichia coli]|uniref:Two-component sensor kinase/response regulator n=1 Tax=Escherichia coli TaxID=562 RepID=A0A3S4JTU9_ECOLX|nr:two-component sensor kinase/response regulator [Escherichia coli]
MVAPGWGLVITQKLVNEMGGDISFHSQPNRGSTFWFHINLDLNPNIIIEGHPPNASPASAWPMSNQTPQQRNVRWIF